MARGLSIRRGVSILIRARPVRAMMALAVLAGTLALAGCFGADGYQMPTQAMKELSPQMLALLKKKNMPKDSPILVRIFKEESELEVWKQDTTGHFQLLKVYPICRWSGDLGPKIKEGDRQAPEGFYPITPALMNPNSSYYLAINMGFPNAYDRANDRHGAFIMIHGDCSSRGCYAMTNEEIGEVYSLAHEAFLGGQKSFQIQAYPFRMTPASLARHRTNPHLPFWRMLKVGNDHFEVTHLEPKVEVCERRYVFDPLPPPGSKKPLVFNPNGRCPRYIVAPEIAALALQKQRGDDAKFAQLVSEHFPVAPIWSGLDGGMNRVFLAQAGGRIPPARVIPPKEAATIAANKSVAPQTRVAAAEPMSHERDRSGSLFGWLFSSKRNSAEQPNAPEITATATATRRSEPAAHRKTVAVALRSRRKTEPNRSELRQASPKSASHQPAWHRSEPREADRVKSVQPQQDTNAAAPTVANGDALINGAQPVVPASSFAGRWAAVH